MSPNSPSNSGPIGKLGLVMLVVADMERSVAFYRDVLGLSVEYESPDWSQLASPDGASIGLHEGSDVGASDGCTMTFYVQSAEDALERLRSGGAEVVAEPNSAGYGVIALARDPDGHAIQVWQH